MNKKLVILTILLSSVFLDDLTYAEDTNSSNPSLFDKMLEGAATQLGEQVMKNMIDNAGGFYLKNECSHPLAIALRYYNVKNGSWDIGYWNFPPNKSSYLKAHEITVKDVSHYYAETSDGNNGRWMGNYRYEGYSMKELSASQLSEKEIGFSC